MKGFRDTHFGCVYDMKGMAWGWIPVFYNAENDRVPVVASRGLWEFPLIVIFWFRRVLGIAGQFPIHEDGPLTEDDLPEGF